MRLMRFFITATCLLFLNVNAQTLLKVQVKANQLIYDSHHNLLYATVGSKDSLYGNSVVAINPATGQVTNTVFAGSEPRAITITSDGNYLFVGLDGATIVKKINVNTFAVEDMINLGADPFYGGYFAHDLATINNRNDIVIVSRSWPGVSPGNAGIVMYKGQTQLPQGTNYTNYSYDIEYDYKKGVFYGYDSQTTGSQLMTFVIDTVNGISPTNTISVNIGQNMKYANRFLFGNGKILVDVSGNVPYQAATFSYNNSPWGYATTANDSASTYYLSETLNGTDVHVVSFNVATYVQSGQVTFSNAVPNNNYQVIGMTATSSNRYAIIVQDTYNANVSNTFGWYVLLRPVSIAGIKEETEEYSIDGIYPNPVSQVLNLKCSCQDYERKEIVINDMCGQTLIKGPYQNSINVAQLGPGFYTISVNGDGISWHSKFVKD